MNPLLILGGAGLALVLLSTRKTSSTSTDASTSTDGSSSTALPTTGASGHKWLVELVGRKGLQGSYIVYEPANPPVHDKYPVLQFAQIGDSPARQLVARFPSVPPDIYKQALKDFLVQETF